MDRTTRISARQAWHDTFFVPKSDALARVSNRKRSAADKPLPKPVGIEKIKGQFFQRVMLEVDVMVETEDGEKTKKRRELSDLLPLMPGKERFFSSRELYTSWDPFWRSRVQSAIRAMPEGLRAFGTIMYAPGGEVRTGYVEIVQELVKEALYNYVGPKALTGWRARKILRLNLLVFAAIRHYRDCVFGGGPTLGGPKAIDNYLYQVFGERLDIDRAGFSQHDHWIRDWAVYWDYMITILDELERQALGRVSAALSKPIESDAAMA